MNKKEGWMNYFYSLGAGIFCLLISIFAFTIDKGIAGAIATAVFVILWTIPFLKLN